ncbi:hypothetical protein GCM10009665_27820 [Kitasatospora nipponensis]|uniref:Uncharacterized protein n=1 Tax=Kitasatospora nipponensis TaxID=258049 RepID=A0ABP4GVN2_9ACTN
MPSSSFEPSRRCADGDLAAAERAVDAMVDALAVAGLPPLASLAAGRLTRTPDGVHVQIGGCSVGTLQAIADHIAAHARCTGRILRGETVPTGLAELPALRAEPPPTTTARTSAMTLRTYRVTGAGHCVELARLDVCEGEPYQRPITGAWPDCACRRCDESSPADPGQPGQPGQPG